MVPEKKQPAAKKPAAKKPAAKKRKVLQVHSDGAVRTRGYAGLPESGASCPPPFVLAAIRESGV